MFSIQKGEGVCFTVCVSNSCISVVKEKLCLCIPFVVNYVCAASLVKQLMYHLKTKALFVS